MDESFDLLSSMSPKIRGRQQTIKTNHVSRLALRKHFRRSLGFDKSNFIRNEDLSIVEINTESSESVTSFGESKDSNDIVVIDSDDDLKATSLPKDHEPKNTRIQRWLKDIDDDKKAETFYSQVSTIFGDAAPIIEGNIAVCSSFDDNNLNHRFDELFINKKNLKKKQSQQLDESSSLSSHLDQIDESSIVDSPLSLHLGLLDSLSLEKNKTSDANPISNNQKKSVQIDESSHESPISLHLDLMLDGWETHKTCDDNGLHPIIDNKKKSVQKDSLAKNKTFDDNKSRPTIDNKCKSVNIDKPSVESPFSLHLDLLISLEKNKTPDDSGSHKIFDHNKKKSQLNSLEKYKTPKVIMNDDNNYEFDKCIDKDNGREELNDSSFSLNLGLKDNLERKLEENKSQIDDKTKSLQLNESPFSLGLGLGDSLERKLEKSKSQIRIKENKQKPQPNELSSSSLNLGFGLRDSLEKDSSIIIINETNDGIYTPEYTPKKTPEDLPRDIFVSRRKKNIETTEVAPKTPDVSIKEASSILDSIYGKKWRANEHEVLLSLSEPKKKQPKPKNMEKKVEVPKTERILKPKIKGNLLPAKKLNFERLKGPIESPWAQKLKGLVDPDSSIEADNFKKTTDIRSTKVRLDFNDNSPIPVIKKPLGGIKNKENNPKSLKKKVVKKSSSSSNSLSEDNYEVSTDDEYDREIQILETKRKSMMPQKQKSYSFLESLSGTVPLNKCDASARIFRSMFKQHREELATKLFKIFNGKVFDNAIPADTMLEWNDKLRKTAGLCCCRKITHKDKRVERKVRISLSSKVLDSADRLRDTLVHEMCHAATWIVNEVSDGHGPYWKNWAFKAMQIFPELPPISRCHSYAINSKYTYRCTKCGYSFGRHSKSLDIARKCCGHCHGKFEVLINKTSKSGETKAVPVGEKKTTGFALFVKENYANFKDPSKKHGDVMKMLGQKFAELKVKHL